MNISFSLSGGGILQHSLVSGAIFSCKDYFGLFPDQRGFGASWYCFCRQGLRFLARVVPRASGCGRPLVLSCRLPRFPVLNLPFLTTVIAMFRFVTFSLCRRLRSRARVGLVVKFFKCCPCGHLRVCARRGSCGRTGGVGFWVFTGSGEPFWKKEKKLKRKTKS